MENTEEGVETSGAGIFDLFNKKSSGSFSQTEAGSRAVLEYKGVKFALRYCPAGTFTMGSSSSDPYREKDEDQRTVRISAGFWICETETTQELWDAIGVKKAKKCNFRGAKLPVDTVTWKESVDFIQKLNEYGIAPKGWRFELPTEEQWEYACRAGTSGSTFGVPLDDCAWHKDNSGHKSHDVGTKQPNKWGIYDMLGNVWEWTSSKYEGKSSDDDPYVDRGGGWFLDTKKCRPAYRLGFGAENSDNDLGFRAVLVPDTPQGRF